MSIPRTILVLQPYRRILAIPGALSFSAAGLLARMPMSMTGLGIVLLISDRTGSYGKAGVLSGITVLAAAAANPLLARLIDRRGQTRVLPVAGAVAALGLSVLIWSVEAGWPVGWTWLAAAVGGACFPPYGSAVRARWAVAVTERGQLTTAFALEGSADEAVFVVGPVIVTFAATSLHPAAGLAVAICCGLTGGLALAAQRGTAPAFLSVRGSAAQRPGLLWSRLLPLCVVAAGLGCLFGSVEVVTVAFADDNGDRSLAGWLLGVWATGSMLAGLLLGTLPGPGRPLLRLRVGAALLAVTVALAGLAPSPVVLGGLLLLSGITIAPTLISATTLAAHYSPATRLTEGITWVTTGLTAGVAPGAALAGVVVDAWGASAGFVVPVAGGLLAATSAWMIRARTASPVGPGALEDETVDKSSAPASADLWRRTDA
ncbi:MAG: MFS transporter [Actinomycetota bacterium]|nr:MFS transporter [Actinomycetota bacterium]